MYYRYFYRQHLLFKLYDTNTKHILADNNEEEDEEDETVWDEAVINNSTNTDNSTSTDSNAASAILIKTLKEENLNLRNNIKTLIKRVTELESLNSSTTTTSITTDPNLTLTPAKPSSLPPSQQQQQWGLSPFTPTTPFYSTPLSATPLPPTTTTTTSSLKPSKNTVVKEEVLVDYHSENSSDVSTTDIAALTGGKAVIIDTYEVKSKIESSPSDKSITATTNTVSPKPEKSLKSTFGTTAATDSTTPLKGVYNEEEEEEEEANNWE